MRRHLPPQLPTFFSYQGRRLGRSGVARDDSEHLRTQLHAVGWNKLNPSVDTPLTSSIPLLTSVYDEGVHVPTPTEKRQAFRALLEKKELIVAPGCYDPMTAKLVQELGFQAASLGGMSTGAHLTYPEPLLTMTDQVDVASRVAKTIDIPLSVDGHNGWGDAIHAIRTIQEYEHAGVTTISMEDQVSPKRASYFRNIIHILPRDEFITKIKRVVEARTDPNLVILGRTDALQAVEGSKEEAVERGKALIDAGVDMLFFRGPREIEDVEYFANAFPDVPKKSIAYGNLPVSVFRDLGYSLISYPTSAILAAYAATRKLYEEIRDLGETPSMTGDHYWEVRKALYRTIGLPELWRIESETVEEVAEPSVVLPTTFMDETA
jgi:2-methylisocitrate lyase-like PEP mutase family enzyme